MVTVSVVSFCVAAFLILDAVIRGTDFFSPGRIYLFFHSMALGVAFLGFHRAMTPFKPFTSLVYFGSAACFLLGTWVVGLLVDSKERVPAEIEPVDLRKYNWNLHLVFAFALFSFFIWGTYGLYNGAGQFPVFAKDKSRALYAFMHNSTWMHDYGYTFGGVVMVLFSMSLFRPSRHPKFLNLSFWMTAITVFIFSLALQRAALMFFVFFLIVFYNNGIRKIRLWKLFGIFFVCFTVILVTGYYKATSLQQQHSNSFVKPSKVFQLALRVPYVYIANNFWNLDYALNPENYSEGFPTTYGLTVLEGVLDGMVLPGGKLGYKIRDGTHIEDQFNYRATKVRGLNTISYQWSWYKDFGVIGVFFGPFLMGMFLNILYWRMRRRTTLLNLAAYSYLAYWLANSYFGSILEAPTYAYGFLYVCLCCYVCQRTFSEAPRSRAAVAFVPMQEG